MEEENPWLRRNPSYWNKKADLTRSDATVVEKQELMTVRETQQRFHQRNYSSDNHFVVGAVHSLAQTR